MHRPAHETVFERCPVAVVANSPALRRAVKRMDRLLEFLEKLFRHRGGKRRTGRNAQPKFWQRPDAIQVAKCLIQSRHPGENCRTGADKIGENGTRRSVAAHDHRHTARDQWREQIAEPIGVRDRDRSKIQIGIADAHRVANLIAIGQQLFAAKPDCARLRRCARGKFQQGYAPQPRLLPAGEKRLPLPLGEG